MVGLGACMYAHASLGKEVSSACSDIEACRAEQSWQWVGNELAKGISAAAS
jgi:hypothetical protein